MKLRLIVFPVILASAAVFVQAKAAGPSGHMAKELGLSVTQKAQMKTIRQQARQTAQPVVDRLKRNRQALSAAVKTGDTAQIQTLSKTQGELRGQALTIRSQARAQIYAGLTNDQRQKMDAIRAQRRKARATVPSTN